MTASDGNHGLAAIPWRSGAVYVVLASSLIGVMGVSLISPVLPELRDVFGISDSQVGLVITAYTLPGIFITPVIGLVADRIGRRRVIIPLLLLFGVAGAGIAVVDSFEEIVALRFLQGIGASALVTLAVTLIGDFYDGAQRNAVMGLNGSVIGAGAAVYPLIGGALAAVRWSAPFLFFGVGVLVGVFATLVLREPETGEAIDVRTYFARLGTVTLLPEALAIFAALLVAFGVFYGGVLTALPLLLSDEYGLSAGEIGPILAMVSLATAAVSSQYGRISAWRTAPELVALGFVAYGASLLGVWAAPSALGVAVALLAFGVGFGIVMPSIDTTMVTIVSGDLRAGMMGMRTSMLRIGQTVGPIGFTYVASTAFDAPTVGYRFLLLGCGVVVILLGAGAYALLRARG